MAAVTLVRPQKNALGQLRWFQLNLSAIATMPHGRETHPVAVARAAQARYAAPPVVLSQDVEAATLADD